MAWSKPAFYGSPMAVLVPYVARIGTRAMVCAADQLAASAATMLLGSGGSAADAAVGAAAVMAVVGPHLCGMGGDLMALVQSPGNPPEALVAAGRAGSGADPERLRSEGAPHMPFRGDVRSVTVPGAVDGWLALHERYGRLSLAAVLEPAIALASEGFSASLLLVLASSLLTVTGPTELCPTGEPLEVDQLVRLPRLARTLRALAEHGRDGFYGGEFGRDLLALGSGEFEPSDLAAPLAVWEEPLHRVAFGHTWWTVPPPSQGYLTLASASIAEHLGLPTNTADPMFALLLMDACDAAGRDRPDVLYDGADGMALIADARIEALASEAGTALAGSTGAPISMPEERVRDAAPYGDGDTTHLCVVDGDGLGISLTQSNALDFGSHLVTGSSGVFLHNRGLGFSLRPGHPAEYGPRRRPPHTLSPAVVTGHDGTLSHVVGAMGGDSQPQVILQIMARMLHAGEDPATAVAAPRVVLHAPGSPPFHLWDEPTRGVLMEHDVPESWSEWFTRSGRSVQLVGTLSPVDVGCSQVVAVQRRRSGVLLTGASDPRSPDGAALGL